MKPSDDSLSSYHLPLLFTLSTQTLARHGRTATPHGPTLDDFPMRAVDLTAGPSRKTLLTDVARETTDDD